MHRDAIQHLDLGASLDDQPFDHIEAVKFPPLRGYLEEIPTYPWRGPTSVFLAIQDSLSFEDVVDGHRRFDLQGRYPCRLAASSIAGVTRTF
jgi:hypothetical protein